MPSEAVSLALAASIYLPALGAVIALGRGAEVRLRVVLFVVAAYLTSLVTGAAMLFLFAELDATRAQIVSPSAALYVVAGTALLLAALRLAHRRQDQRSRDPGRPARTDRYLQDRRLVPVLGVLLYVVPSPIFAGAVNVLAGTDASAAQQLVYLAEMLLIMLWIIELPMLMLIAFPTRGLAALESINSWFSARARTLLVLVIGAFGAYLVVVGAIELVP
jgi:hypothetical protein